MLFQNEQFRSKMKKNQYEKRVFSQDCLLGIYT